MRCTQFIGLNNRAKDLLKRNKVRLYTEHRVRTYPDGRVEIMPEVEMFDIPQRDSTEKWTGMFEEENEPLVIYTLKDGREVEEYVQEEIWSSGPMIFLALKDYISKEPLKDTLWTCTELGSY